MIVSKHLSIFKERVLSDIFDNVILQITEMVLFNLQLCVWQILNLWRISRNISCSSSIWVNFWRHSLCQQKVVLMVPQVNLVLLHHSHELVVNILGIKSVLNVFNKLMTNIIANSLNKSLSDGHDDSKSWSLSNFTLDLASHCNWILFHVLMEELVVEFLWSFFSHLVRKFTTLWLNHIRFSWRNAVSLRVFTFCDSVLNSLLVIPCRIFVLD